MACRLYGLYVQVYTTERSLSRWRCSSSGLRYHQACQAIMQVKSSSDCPETECYDLHVLPLLSQAEGAAERLQGAQQRESLVFAHAGRLQRHSALEEALPHTLQYCCNTCVHNAMCVGLLHCITSTVGWLN